MPIHRGAGTVISGRVEMVSIVQISVVDFILQFCHFHQVHPVISEPTKRSEIKFMYIFKALRFTLLIPTPKNNWTYLTDTRN